MSELAAERPRLPLARLNDGDHEAPATLEERRRRDRERQRRYRERRRVRRCGGAVVELHLTWGTLSGLRKLGLLPEGESQPEQVAQAVQSYLAATVAPIADMSGRFQAL